jgi:acyl-CoA synthetase (AMP-forming)/AMP-acid ligase II
MKPPLNSVDWIGHRLSDRQGSSPCSLPGRFLSGRFLSGGDGRVCLGDLSHGTSLGGRLDALSGRSVLLAARSQLSAAIALLELDGVARRIVIAPPDIAKEYFPFVIASAEIDAIVSDQDLSDLACAAGLLQIPCTPRLSPAQRKPLDRARATEWVLLTSGTTGSPKMILHSLASLTAPIDMCLDNMNDPGVVWGTFYDIRRYGGLQIFLRAILGRGSMVLSGADEPVANHLERLRTHHVTHLSGTPSHWRRALMSPAAHSIHPRYVRLSGEIVDQAILDALHSFFPGASIGHAFASTEAGVAFEVTDGLAGFPAVVFKNRGAVEMKLRNDSLLIRSSRTASRYLTPDSGPLAAEDGFVDTGDIVERHGDRCYFLGRRNRVVNVGGMKVYPEEIEAVIQRHPAVRMCIAKPRNNPFTGALVSVDVVLKDSHADPSTEILEICRRALPPHKRPVTIRYVPALEVGAAGKLIRRYA